MSSTLLNQLVAWWGLHDATNAENWLDNSGNGNTLTQTADTLASVSGLIGPAASFPGDAVVFLTRDVLVPNPPFSFSIWVKPTSITGGGLNDTICQTANSAARQTMELNTDGSVFFRVRGGAFGFLATSAGLVVLGVWNHLVMTYDGTVLKGYINGILRVSGSITIGTFGANFLRIGTNATGSSDPFNGLATLAGVWRRVLTDGHVNVGNQAGEEIAELYNQGYGFDPTIVIEPLHPPEPAHQPTNTGACRGQHAGGGFTWLPADDCPTPTV